MKIHTSGFHPQTQSQNHLAQHNERYHRKVLLNIFHFLKLVTLEDFDVPRRKSRNPITELCRLVMNLVYRTIILDGSMFDYIGVKGISAVIVLLH